MTLADVFEGRLETRKVLRNSHCRKRARKGEKCRETERDRDRDRERERERETESERERENGERRGNRET